jgi:hypothetical protein
METIHEDECETESSVPQCYERRLDMARKARIVKASRYTFAKKGFLVFFGKYPKMKMKYCKTKSGATKVKKRFESGHFRKGE